MSRPYAEPDEGSKWVGTRNRSPAFFNALFSLANTTCIGQVLAPTLQAKSSWVTVSFLNSI
jgi:hypothetical protein